MFNKIFFKKVKKLHICLGTVGCSLSYICKDFLKKQ